MKGNPSNQEKLELITKKRNNCSNDYNLRYNRSLNFFKNSFQTGILGDLHSVRCEVGHYLPYWRTNTDYRKSVSAQKILGGGVLLELSHEIDYLIWIFGSISKVNAFLTRHSSLEIDVEDTAYLRLELSNTHQHNPSQFLQWILWIGSY